MEEVEQPRLFAVQEVSENNAPGSTNVILFQKQTKTRTVLE